MVRDHAVVQEYGRRHIAHSEQVFSTGKCKKYFVVDVLNKCPSVYNKYGRSDFYR